MKKIFLLLMLLMAFGLNTYAQISYSGKFELGSLRFQNTTFEADALPDWKGYYIENQQNGIDVNLINGLSYKEKIFAGIGLGYLNFEGVSGCSVLSDFEYLPLKTKLTPIINFKIGYTHIWNQYENGTGSTISEFTAGLNFRFSEKIGLYLKSGLTITQQAYFVPVRIGLRYY